MEGPLFRPLPFWRQRSGGLTVAPDYHRPALVEEVVGLLAPVAPGLVLDATFGGGGHTRALLAAAPGLQVLAMDRDPAATANAGDLDVEFHQGDFRDAAAALAGRPLAGALFDLGVSSHQLDEGVRGFSYRNDGPLDMRMGPDAALDAATIVNTWSHADLARVIRRYGEERFAGRIAAAIVRSRPLRTTAELAEAVAGSVPAAARRRSHPARRTFQAIRIAVNDELGALEDGLDAVIAALRTDGRVAVISYHSLEDRIVKRRFAAGARGCVCPPELPVCACDNTAELRLLTRKPVRPSEAEAAANPRARSARLRAAEKVAA